MSKQRKIAIDARMIEMSGIGTYIQHIIQSDIYDYAIGKEEEIKRYNPLIKIIPFDASIYGLKEQLRFPSRAVSEANIDLVHFPHYNVPISYRGKYVVTIHDLTHIVFPQFLGRKIKYYYAKFLMTQAIRRALHIFTVSEYSKKDIIKHFNVPSDKISITYNAIDSDYVIKDPEKTDYLYSKYNISHDQKVILYVGNLKPHKNLIVLLKALQEMKRDDVILILAGKAFDNADLENQEKEMGIQDRVIHTGLVSKKELIDLYNMAEIFVFPSLYEGFGIPPLEAMACGTPVIAANNSSIPEVCGDAALLVDGKSPVQIAETIKRLLDDEKLYNAMVEKGLKHSKFFSWTDTSTRIRETFERLV